MSTRLILPALRPPSSQFLRAWRRSGHTRLDPPARCRPRVDVDLAPNQTQAFPHADKPKSRLAIERKGVEAFAIVHDPQADGRCIARQFHKGVLSCAVL